MTRYSRVFSNYIEPIRALRFLSARLQWRCMETSFQFSIKFGFPESQKLDIRSGQPAGLPKRAQLHQPELRHRHHRLPPVLSILRAVGVWLRARESLFRG